MKKYLWMSSAAVVIGALRVKHSVLLSFQDPQVGQILPTQKSGSGGPLSLTTMNMLVAHPTFTLGMIWTSHQFLMDQKSLSIKTFYTWVVMKIEICTIFMECMYIKLQLKGNFYEVIIKKGYLCWPEHSLLVHRDMGLFGQGIISGSGAILRLLTPCCCPLIWWVLLTLGQMLVASLRILNQNYLQDGTRLVLTNHFSGPMLIWTPTDGNHICSLNTIWKSSEMQ